MNQDYDSEQNYLLDFQNLPSIDNFGHQQNLAFLAQDLLNEAKKLEPNEDKEVIESESDSDEELKEQDSKTTSSNSTKRRAKQKNPEAKKHKSQFQRKNIK